LTLTLESSAVFSPLKWYLQYGKNCSKLGFLKNFLIFETCLLRAIIPIVQMSLYGLCALAILFKAIMQAKHTCDSHFVLALATFGSMTEIGSFLSLSLHPRWPRQIQMCHCRVPLSPALSCNLCQCKHALRFIYTMAIIALS
jgi:hypothetical protein